MSSEFVGGNRIEILHLLCPGMCMKILVPSFGVFPPKILEPKNLVFSLRFWDFYANIFKMQQDIVSRKMALQTTMPS